MSNMDARFQRAIVIWLSGVRLAEISMLHAVEMLIARGAVVALNPIPITGSQTQHYQVLSGRSPACFGFFDTFVPQNYSVIEQSAGRSGIPELMPSLLRAAGWAAQYEEIRPWELVDCVRRCMQPDAAPQSHSCLILKCAPGAQLSDISESLFLARQWVGEAGLLAVLSDSQPAPVKHFVNINNFLADIGIIEREEQSGQVNWQNSLAYHVGHGQLWVNLLGRDAQGAVHPQGEYEEVRETLAKALPNKLRDAETGELVIERIYRKEELYSGDYLFCAPDLVILFKPGYAPSPHSIRLDFDKTTFTTPAVDETSMAGVHPSMLEGFLLASAPAFEPGGLGSESAPLTAVAPTLLHALGVRYVDFDSPAIGSLFTSSYLENHPIHTVSQNKELSVEEEELIIDRLRDLGYV